MAHKSIVRLFGIAGISRQHNFGVRWLDTAFLSRARPIKRLQAGKLQNLSRSLFAVFIKAATCYAAADLISVAFNLISVPARACDTGQPFFAASAASRKVCSSIPGTSPSVVSSIVVILNPSPTFSRLTLAFVLMRVGL